MKSKLSLVGAALAVLVAVTVSAEKPKHKTVRNSIFITSPPAADPAYDRNGNLANGDPPLPGNTLVYEDAAGLCDHRYPITAPDGRQLTLAEWQSAKGEAQAKCGENGTKVHLKLKGLVPNGVYTIWLAIFDAPGLTPDFSALVGLGALGLPDGSQNHFVASADGKAELSALHPAGALSMFGEVSDCLLKEYEVLLWLALHLDNQTHGPTPGDECELAFPGGFSFK